MVDSDAYAILGATGNCGTALIDNLLRRSDTVVRAYCRSRTKLLRSMPDLKEDGKVKIFEGSIQDVELVASCVYNCRAVFLVISTNDNIPGCRMAQDTATTVIDALKLLRKREMVHNDGDLKAGPMTMPKLILLSSSTIDSHFSRHMPYLLRSVLLCSASHVYRDVAEAEKLIRAEDKWLTGIYMKPGALSVDKQRGHAVSLTDQDGPVSYLDLAAAMIEAVDDEGGRYNGQNISVVNTNGSAKFPTGTPMCILMGLLRHFFPTLHDYLPGNLGPR
ncbi:Oxidoreductase AflX [Cladophialophora carrionii]|uniref:Oxidoreductase AflX n=1 Tax=Cladophialophora carrionii TaxID=86049 RepID=A0A1C1CNG2_9EURO|nr:Oxidoreductase AflX [Cladophialophora carrionii]